MSLKITRREMLGRSFRAAGLMVFRGLPGALAAQAEQIGTRALIRTKTAPSLPVAIQRCESYEPKLIRQRMDRALDLIGGIGNLVRNKTVTIKLNLTGGMAGLLGGQPPHLTYHVHPHAVAALCAAVHDAGARRIIIVESQYSLSSPEEVLSGGGWDVPAIKSAGGQRVTFEDTRNRGRWPAYSRLKVPWGGFAFPAFDVNQRYEKTDVFISLGKMKNHAAAGVTLTVKNLFGIAPTSLYGNEAPKEDTTSYRGAILHDGTKTVSSGVPAEIGRQKGVKMTDRVPRVTADLLGARPVDLAVIDGVETCRGGEGPWIEGVEPIQPRLLLAGRNAVCTDAVGAAVMGYDPKAKHGQSPFPGENHLQLLDSVGVGSNDAKRIDIVGLPLDKAVHPFSKQASSKQS